MALGRFRKQPREKKRYAIDYTAWLGAGETIIGTPIFEVELDIEDGGPGTLIVDTVSVIDGTSVQYFVSAGDDNEQYKVTILIETSDTQKKEDEIIYVIEEE